MATSRLWAASSRSASQRCCPTGPASSSCPSWHFWSRWPASHCRLSRKRPAAQDPELARGLGIDTRRMVAATFALGVALAGIAGVLLADRFAIAPAHGLDLLVKAYIAVAIAGWGRVGGAALVALLIALIETLGGSIVPGAAIDAALYIFLLILLVLRPEGWFGAAAQRRE